MPKKVYYRTNEELMGVHWAAKIYNYGVSLTVISAVNEMYSAEAVLMDRKDLYRHLVKKYCREAVHYAQMKETDIRNAVASKAFWLDYSDKVIDEAEKDITTFREKIMEELVKCNIPNPEIIARAECTRIITDMAVKQFEGIARDAFTKFGCKCATLFDEYNLKNAYMAWQKMTDVLYKGMSADLNTEAIIEAYKAIFDKFINGKYIDSCVKCAMENNPEFNTSVGAA